MSTGARGRGVRRAAMALAAAVLCVGAPVAAGAQAPPPVDSAPVEPTVAPVPPDLFNPPTTLPGPAPAPVTTVTEAGVKITRDVVMTTVPTDPPTVLTVDIFQPPDSVPAPEGGRPAIVLVHGGSWFQGGPSILDQQGVLVAAQGWVGFSVSYRLATGSRPSYPDAVGDVQRGVRWVGANAGRWGAEPSRIGVIGASAGGHLAAQVANFGTDPIITGPLSAPPFTPPFPESNPPVTVKVVATWSAPFVLTELVPDEGKPPFACGSNEACQRFWTIPIVQNLLGCELKTCREVYQQASPVNRVTRATAPMWIANADDEIVPLGQLQLMGDALIAGNVDHQVLIVEGKAHADQYTDKAWNDMVPFLADHLGVARPEPVTFALRGDGPGGGFTATLGIIAALVILVGLGIYSLSTREAPSLPGPGMAPRREDESREPAATP